MTSSSEPQVDRQELAATIVELQANRASLDSLATHCTVFRFTGGTVLRPNWSTSCIGLQATRSLAREDNAAQNAGHYLSALNVLGQLQRGVAMQNRPRKLRDRFAIADSIERVVTEFVSLGSRLESTLTRVLDAAGPRSSVHVGNVLDGEVDG